MIDDRAAFDRPLFKRLAHNDTGQAAGHQAGVVIPSEMDAYFPAVGRLGVAPGINIIAALFDGPRFLAEVETRYQYQTWGGTRSPERRVTGNLAPLRDLAVRGDILLIERGVADPTRYRLTLLRQNTPEFGRIEPSLGTRRWGPLVPTDPPVAEPEVVEAHRELTKREQADFEPFDAAAGVVETHTKRVARSRAFQARLLELYECSCAMCGSSLRHPNGKTEAEAAHIIPRGLRGQDDARNGLLLCRQHHWALDAGLVGVGRDRRIIVPDVVAALPANRILAEIRGERLRPPTVVSLAPSLVALSWHRANMLLSN